jgi:protease I
MAKILMIIPPERFRDEELFITREKLENVGHSVTIASTKTGLVHGSRGGQVIAELMIDEVNLRDYVAVVFVGGGGSKLLFNNLTAIKIAKAMNDQKKIVAAICLAPVILANAGILMKKKATVAGTEAKTIEKKGACYTGPGVTVDRNIVTGNAPKASGLFAEKINELLRNRY